MLSRFKRLFSYREVIRRSLGAHFVVVEAAKAQVGAPDLYGVMLASPQHTMIRLDNANDVRRLFIQQERHPFTMYALVMFMAASVLGVSAGTKSNVTFLEIEDNSTCKYHVSNGATYQSWLMLPQTEETAASILGMDFYREQTL